MKSSPLNVSVPSYVDMGNSSDFTSLMPEYGLTDATISYPSSSVPPSMRAYPPSIPSSSASMQNASGEPSISTKCGTAERSSSISNDIPSERLSCPSESLSTV